MFWSTSFCAVAKIHTLAAFDFLSDGALTMDRLSDEELFTSPLTFMGVPYGRPGPGNKRGHPRHPVRLRHQHARSARAAARIRCASSRR